MLYFSFFLTLSVFKLPIIDEDLSLKMGERYVLFTHISWLV